MQWFVNFMQFLFTLLTGSVEDLQTLGVGFLVQ